MKKRIMTGLLAVLIHTPLFAQNVTFRSTGIENRVKYHLGLSASDNITRAQLDTITQLNLSGMGLTDIYDLRKMPRIRQIDLSHNKIDDVRPLALLDSLCHLDLSYNQLENINMLAFSNAIKMEVDVSFNKISDFSLFDTLTPCQFSFEGVGLQNWNTSFRFRVSYLYTDGTSKTPVVHCRLEASTTDKAMLTAGDAKFTVETDGLPHKCQLDERHKETTKVEVTDGESSDSTYLVPRRAIHVNPSQKVTIETGLPGNYEIRYPAAQQGTLSNDSVNLVYTANADFSYEEVVYTYYRGGVLKGISKIFLTKEEVTEGIDMPETPKARWDISYADNMMRIKCMSETLADESYIDVCDISGKVFASRRADSRHGIDEQIPLGHLANSVIIVKVRSGKNILTEKLLVP